MTHEVGLTHEGARSRISPSHGHFPESREALMGAGVTPHRRLHIIGAVNGIFDTHLLGLIPGLDVGPRPGWTFAPTFFGFSFPARKVYRSNVRSGLSGPKSDFRKRFRFRPKDAPPPSGPAGRAGPLPPKTGPGGYPRAGGGTQSRLLSWPRFHHRLRLFVFPDGGARPRFHAKPLTAR